MTSNHRAVLRRGYVWCTVTCVCEPCMWAEEWFGTLLTGGMRMFRDDEQEIPGPAEFRGVGLEEAA